MTKSDTIFALASGSGRAGVAVYRLSGPAAGAVLTGLSQRALPPARRAVRVRLFDSAGDPIDDGLALWFPGPHSFTGEDVVELHLHGGHAVARVLGEALVELRLRPAEAGEFSRRAVLNGKLDLTRAEAIADLVDAETVMQQRRAMRQLDGEMERQIDHWRDRLVTFTAQVTALIDFSDEDIPDSLWCDVERGVSDLAQEVEEALGSSRRGVRLRDGVWVAIVGAPNVGKSSLLNCIAGREAAIVSSVAGTTRDIIEVHLDLGGWPVVIADTAGLREAGEEIEAEGVRRALARCRQADLKIAVFSAEKGAGLDAATLEVVDDETLVVVNKVDMIGGDEIMEIKGRRGLAVSAATGVGIAGLLKEIEGRVGGLMAGAGSAMFTRERHRAVAGDCLRALRRFSMARGVELAAEDLRDAATALGRMTGRVGVEEVLDAVFRGFCIGK